jgi:hypothetical protein
MAITGSGPIRCPCLGDSGALRGVAIFLSHPFAADGSLSMLRLRCFSWILVGLLANAAHAVSFNAVVTDRIQPQVERLVVQLAQEGRAMQIDGTAVFNGSDKFLPGKIALAFADLISTLPPTDPRLDQYLKQFRSLARLTVDDANDSWGIYYYLSALNQLQSAGRMQAALDPLTLAKLRVRLDWRTFVDVDTFALIDHPNNYYCVAFAIARLRNRLGWEDASGAARLYAAMTSHYLEYSGSYGFADETAGEGRFDRYSILLAGEISERLVETGERPPSQILEWLRKSVDVMKLRLNPRGEGFEYGRSLGPYGETAIVEVMTAAAVLGVLDDREKDLAYAYASRAAQRYADFWLDSRTGSVNLWDGGRRTDGYRGKFRIMGENLSVGHQYLYTNALWNRMGYRDREPLANFAAALSKLPEHTVTWFARGEYDRLLVTLREPGMLISLPLINGGVSQHMHNPYFPTPFSPGMLAGVADGDEPLLLPRFELEDGSQLMPLAYFRDVEVIRRGKTTRVTYRQGELDRLGAESPQPDGRLSVRTTYIFEPGSITRTDVYTPREPLAIKSIAMAFGSFSSGASMQGSKVKFSTGQVKEFQASGFDDCTAGSADGDKNYQTPNGPFASKVWCSRQAFELTKPMTMSWKIRYSAR